MSTAETPAADAPAPAPDAPAVSRRTLWLCVLPAMFLPAVGAFCYFILFRGSPVGNAIFTFAKGFILTWPFIAVLLIERQRFQPRTWFNRRSLSTLPLGLATGLLISGTILGLFFFTPLGDFVWTFAPMVREQCETMGFVSWFIPFALMMSLGNSLLEEYYWRWYVFGRLDKLLPSPWSHIVAGIAFSLHHYVVLSPYFPAWAVIFFGTFVGVGGVIWSIQYKRGGSLLGSWLSHIMADLAAILWIGHLLIFSTPPA